MSAPRLLHVGGVVLDLVYRIEDLPPTGGERVASAATLCPGGAYHTLAAATAQGLDACCAGGHGTGPFGDIVRAALARLGVPTLLPRSSGLDTGTCVVLVTADGERTFVGHPGAEGELAVDALAGVRARAEDAVVLSGYTASFPGCHGALAAWLPTLDARATLVFDPSPVVASIPPDLLDRILARTDWPSANAREAAALVGREAPAGTLAGALLERCPRARGALVRDGADGCHLALRGARARHLPGHAVRAIDTSGAGDVHVGTFVARLAAGDAPTEAARVANAAAALSVTRPSGAPTPSAEEVRRFPNAPAEA